VNAEFSNADQTAGALFTKHDYQNGCVTSKIDSTTSSSKGIGDKYMLLFQVSCRQAYADQNAASTWLDK